MAARSETGSDDPSARSPRDKIKHPMQVFSNSLPECAQDYSWDDPAYSTAIDGQNMDWFFGRQHNDLSGGSTAGKFQAAR